MDILEHKPTDIKSFAYVWLQNYSKINIYKIL